MIYIIEEQWKKYRKTSAKYDLSELKRLIKDYYATYPGDKAEDHTVIEAHINDIYEYLKKIIEALDAYKGGDNGSLQVAGDLMKELRNRFPQIG